MIKINDKISVIFENSNKDIYDKINIAELPILRIRFNQKTEKRFKVFGKSLSYNNDLMLSLQEVKQ